MCLFFVTLFKLGCVYRTMFHIGFLCNLFEASWYSEGRGCFRRLPGYIAYIFQDCFVVFHNLLLFIYVFTLLPNVRDTSDNYLPVAGEFVTCDRRKSSRASRRAFLPTLPYCYIRFANALSCQNKLCLAYSPRVHDIVYLHYNIKFNSIQSICVSMMLIYDRSLTILAKISHLFPKLYQISAFAVELW